MLKKGAILGGTPLARLIARNINLCRSKAGLSLTQNAPFACLDRSTCGHKSQGSNRMKALQHKWRANQLWDVLLRANPLLAQCLVITILALATMGLGQAWANADESDTSSVGASGDAVGDYRLSPGDRLTIVVFDQPQ